MDGTLQPNEGKLLTITTDFGLFARYPVKTKVVNSGDSLTALLDEYVRPHIQQGDTLIMSEKIVAISQGRAFPVSEIKISRLAKFLVKFVTKSPYGIGIGSEATMELAVREVGRVKIVFAAIVAALGKVVGKRGLFYVICGAKARAIDGPCDYTLPPYNNYAKLAPDKPNEVAAVLAAHIGLDVVVIDANDLGVNVLGKSRPDLDDKFAEQVFADNPLAQGSQQTPIAIVRRSYD
ncbi:MAG: coenzyme F420-0:L-glutamate ligase [Oscillospiraceae bacterium]|jgi:F420-0:gamma-glutamyl ligase-like protein|nr:coenzyme F420-0:L-glutamate ligase [Oscillospiraceae bacterium]